MSICETAADNRSGFRGIPSRIGDQASRQPGGASIKWHAHVRIDDDTYRQLRDHLLDLATHRSAENLAREFARILFARYAPIRRQLLNILRAVNERRKQHNFELLNHSVLKLRRTPVPVYVRPETTESPAQSLQEAA